MLEAATSVPDRTVDVEAAVLVEADRIRLVDAVAALPEHLREVVILVMVDEMPYRDVAATLGVPEGTVKSRMSHARARLAAVMTEERA